MSEMEKAIIWSRLVAANPVALSAAREVTETMGLEQIVNESEESSKQDHRLLTSAQKKWQSQRLMGLILAVAATLTVGGALAVGPALGWRMSQLLSFFDAQIASRQAQIDFGSMAAGAPEGMDPGAIPEETRRIREASFAGDVHTLWVAPTKLGGFCYLWSPGIGGCNARGLEQLDAVGELTLPPGVVAPPIPKNATKNEMLSAMRAGHDLATVPVWIVGYLKGAGGASSIVIRFRDGTTAEPEVTWVSSPINAGFFAYDVPQDKRTSANHAVSVESASPTGMVLNRQILVHGR